MSEEIVRRLWSREDAKYYEELERFMKTHGDATSITFSNEFGCPVKAEYYFAPYVVVKEHYQLMEALAKESAKAEAEEEA